MGMSFLSVLFRQAYKEKTSSVILECGGYLISSQHLQHCWFRLACTEISANEWSHNLSWTQNYWRVTVKHVCTCGKSPSLHKLCVTLTRSVADERRWLREWPKPKQHSWCRAMARLATCPSAPLLCLRAVCQAMPYRRRTRVVSHFHTPSSAHFLPTCWPKAVELDKLLEHIAASHISNKCWISN